MIYPDWVRDPQDYEIEQERYRQAQVLWQYGEYGMFVLMWRTQDYENDLVTHCSTCFTAYGKIAEVYKQPALNKCPNCFGTTFEGGFRAKVVRPTLWDMTEEDQRPGTRGETITQTSSIQAPSDFRLHTGDYVFRGDGTRWQVRTLANSNLRSGFEMPEWREDIGWNFGNVGREDESSVAFLIPPNTATLIDRLDISRFRYPADMDDLEVIRGPLI